MVIEGQRQKVREEMKTVGCRTVYVYRNCIYRNTFAILLNSSLPKLFVTS